MMPKEWEAIVAKAAEAAMSRGYTSNIDDFLRDAAERCYALHCKPQRELTDAEIEAISDKVEFAKFADDLAFARACIAAHQRKQQEPETVKVKVRFWRYTDSPQLNAMSEQNGDISKATPWDYGNTEWVGEPQEIEVKV